MNQLNELEILLKHLIDFERLKYIQRQELFSLLDQPDITLNTFLNSLPQRAQTFKSQQNHLQTLIENRKSRKSLRKTITNYKKESIDSEIIIKDFQKTKVNKD